MAGTVAIAGGGPSGLMLACELGLAGVPTVLFERRVQPRQPAPGVAINSATVELLEQRGLMEALSGQSVPFALAHFALLPLDTAKLTERHASSVLLAQHDLERRLEKRAVELDVDVRRGHEVVGFHQDETGVTVAARSAQGMTSVPADYLVGCDGADSKVRELAGIPFAGLDLPFYGIMGEFEVAFDDLTPELLGVHYCPAGAHYMGVPLGPDVMRVITAEFCTEPPARQSVTLDELQARVRHLTGADLKVTKQQWICRYGNPTGQAASYRNGAVFLAGDSAHTHFPLNGLALNTGLHDAVNLGWKLGLVMHGWAPPSLLDTYHQERYPVGQLAVRNVQAQLTLSLRADISSGLREVFSELIDNDEVNNKLSAMVLGIDVRYPPAHPIAAGNERPHPLLGRRLPAVPLKTAQGDTTTAKALHAGHGVLLDFSSGTELLREVSPWQQRVYTVSAEPTPEIPAAAVLLRPDGHVAWAATTGAGPGGLPEALAAWFGPASPVTR